MNVVPARWLVALALFAALATWRVDRFYPPLPNPLELEFVLAPRSHENQSDPIITSGTAGRADFLYFHRSEQEKGFIGYDSWNSDRARTVTLPLTSGKRHRLRVEMPALDHYQGHSNGQQPGLVRVWLDGMLVLDEKLHFHLREDQALYIGENPVGGTSAELHFSGQIFDASGRELRGGATRIFSWSARLRGWIVHGWEQVLALLALSLAVGGLGGLLQPARLRDLAPAAGRVVLQHRWFAGAAIVCAAVFSWFVTMGGFDFNFPESFCTFYDFQARSLLQGRLDVPEECLAGEAFVVEGKVYGYFGVTPALLRLPWAAFDVGLGRLSRWFMLIDYIAALVGAYLVFLTARRVVCGESDPPRPFLTLLFIANVGLGSTLLFLGGRSYIYHEAILCGAAFGFFAVWCTLHYAEEPESRWWIGAFVCGLLAVHARPPIGLFALALLGAVALRQTWSRRQITPAFVAILCVAGTLSFNALAYLKFKTFDGQPLRYNANYSPERLAKFGERKFHLENIPFVATSYLVAPSFTVEPGFPWFYAEPKPTWRPPWTKMDMIEPTVAFPITMPVLFVLATVGAVVAWRTRPVARERLVLLVLAVTPTTLLLFAAIAISQRYTADFVPFLVSTAAFGLVALDEVSGRWRATLHAALAAATLWAVGVTTALTLHLQGEQVWGVPDSVHAEYQQLRQRVDRIFAGNRR